MILSELGIPGPRLVEQDRHTDERGFFARTYGAAEFDAAGLEPIVRECSVSFNRARATLRGMHFQRGPSAEAKLVRCTRGRIWDVAVDIRPTSPAFGRWASADLDSESGRAMYVPAGFAHGFVTLEPASEVFYQSSRPHDALAEAGFRWDDPDVSVDWPLEPVVMSERDRRLPSLVSLRTLLLDDP